MQFCTRRDLLEKQYEQAELPTEFRGKWGWQDLGLTFGVPFSDYAHFMAWVCARPRMFMLGSQALGAAIIKRAMHKGWSNPGSKRFWWVQTALIMRAAAIKSIDNDLVDKLTDTGFVVFDHADRVGVEAQELFLNIVWARRSAGNISLFIVNDPLLKTCSPDLRAELERSVRL